jgi:hypothetical protein
MDVANLIQFDNIMTDCSTPPLAADTTIAVDAFVQPVVRTFEDAIRFVGSSMECSPAARTVLKTALRQIAWGVSVANARDSGQYLDPDRKKLDLARMPFDVEAINGALTGVSYRTRCRGAQIEAGDPCPQSQGRRSACHHVENRLLTAR